MQLIVFLFRKKYAAFFQNYLFPDSSRQRPVAGVTVGSFKTNTAEVSSFNSARHTSRKKLSTSAVRCQYTAGCVSDPQLVPIRLSRPQHAFCWRVAHPATDFSDTHTDTANKPKSPVFSSDTPAENGCRQVPSGASMHGGMCQ